MSWMPPELATYREDKGKECDECGEYKFVGEYSDSDYMEMCNDCYEEYENKSICCGAFIVLEDICSECMEHI
jgi:hypothetical protein